MNEKTGFSLNGYLMALILAIAIPLLIMGLDPAGSPSVVMSFILLLLTLGCWLDSLWCNLTRLRS